MSHRANNIKAHDKTLILHSLQTFLHAVSLFPLTTTLGG